MLFLHQQEEGLIKIRGLTLDVLEGLGFLINYKKSELSPIQRINFLGFTVDLLSMTISLPEEKIQSTIKEAHVIITEGNISKATSSHYRNFLLNNPSRASCPPTLQKSPISQTPGPQIREQLLPRDAHPGSPGRPTVVACHLHNINGQPILRAQPSLMITTDRRALEKGGKGMPHQLPQVLLQREEGDCSPLTAGQFHSHSLHQSPGGDTVPSAMFPGNGHLVMVPGQEVIPYSIPHPRSSEHGGRQPFQIGSGQTRLETERKSARETEHAVGASLNKHLCHKNFSTTSNIHYQSKRIEHHSQCSYSVVFCTSIVHFHFYIGTCVSIRALSSTT